MKLDRHMAKELRVNTYLHMLIFMYTTYILIKISICQYFIIMIIKIIIIIMPTPLDGALTAPWSKNEYDNYYWHAIFCYHYYKDKN